MIPQVSVVILNFNGHHLLSACLSSLQRQTFKDFETILVDNGSKDGSADWVAASYPSVRLIRLSKNLGFSEGNNVGILASQGKFIALLNNDTEVDPEWLEHLYKHMSSDDTIAACDSKVLYFDQRDTIWCVGGDYSAAGAAFFRGQNSKSSEYQQPSDVFIAVACAAMYRRSVMEEIGLFDKDFFNGFEDVDWSFRARLRGYRIVNVPASCVYHKVSATTRHNNERYVEMYVYNGQRNVTAVFIKNMPNELLVRYWPLHLIYILGSMVYFIKVGQLRAFLRAKQTLLKQWPDLWRKRKQIQSLHTSPVPEIERMFYRSWFRSKFQKILE